MNDANSDEKLISTFSEQDMRSLFPELVDETFTNGSGPDLDVDEGLQVVGLHVGVVAAKRDQRWSKVQSLRLKLVSLLK